MHQITLFPETKFKKMSLGDTPPHTHPDLQCLDPRFSRAYGARHPPPPFENPGSATVNNIMSVLGYGRDEMLAVFLAKTYCLPILLYGCETWRMSSSDKHKVDVAWNNCFRKNFNACWRESAKPLLFYCGTMPVSLLVDQRKMIFL